MPETKKDILVIKDLLIKDEINWNDIKDKVIILWHQLTNLGTMYEDLCREWYLPKIIGLMTSYPTMPEIIDKK